MCCSWRSLCCGRTVCLRAGRSAPPEPLTGTFIAPGRAWAVPRWLIAVAAVGAAVLPFTPVSAYVLQVLTNAWLYAILALSLTLVAGTIGQISLGHAGLLAIGAYASALLAMDLSVPVWAAVLAAGVITALLGTALIVAGLPAARPLRFDRNLGRGRDRRTGHPELGRPDARTDGADRHPAAVARADPARFTRWRLLGVAGDAGRCWPAMQVRLLHSHLGRTFRAIRDDDVAARSYGIAWTATRGLLSLSAGSPRGSAARSPRICIRTSTMKHSPRRSPSWR